MSINLSGGVEQGGRRQPEKADALTHRQLECLAWTGEGKSARDIGQILGISRRTVEEHLEKACAVFGVRTRIQAVMRAREQGLLDFHSVGRTA
ncbi:helix-turn-helix transcriptional regulator [Phenylobacterium sp.]|uniref:response regulator transcription factor n=1 Tax=Phenylobacterium sp. TaxID=1871053 RepID=UPI0025FB826C|nr:helix-turn-helix transcriptional regulator [Phenylobacterium sp.]